MGKQCSQCKVVKEYNEFYQRKKHRAGEYYERCKECFKTRGRVYYHQNQNRQLKLALLRKKRYREERKIWLEKLKDRPCLDCGVKYPPYVMDFDHTDGQIKVATISWLAIRNTSNFEKIKLEIKKCDLVCANCHRQRTYERLTSKQATVAKVVKAPV